MGSSFPLKRLAGYTSRTVPFKVISDDTTINADVVYPETSDGFPLSCCCIITAVSSSSGIDIRSCHTGLCMHVPLVDGSL
ncbi:hypothetical protein GQ607_005076 [Colletotrichum asianum]|uniref:Uncharacterized protein n=1 Tax=Colletotrichum asianum TaxID=702518 RepID=A0A8H3WL92_9PEZI|nr:hypothetical protein GQ607_005076 [Colletotrichum asianum]